MARPTKAEAVAVEVTAGGVTARTTQAGLERLVDKIEGQRGRARPARESTFEVALAGVPWNSGGSERAVKLEVTHVDGRPDGLLMFLTQAGRGAVDVTLRANRVESTASWRGIALIDSATWKPAGEGKSTHPALSLKMTVPEDANKGPKTLRELVRFRLGLGEEGLQAVEIALKPYDGPLFPDESAGDAP